MFFPKRGVSFLSNISIKELEDEGSVGLDLELGYSFCSLFCVRIIRFVVYRPNKL